MDTLSSLSAPCRTPPLTFFRFSCLMAALEEGADRVAERFLNDEF